jgi:hypothetical protein
MSYNFFGHYDEFSGEAIHLQILNKQQIALPPINRGSAMIL